MAMTQAQIARQLLVGQPDGVFARAALPAVQHRDFTLLERMLPGVKFDTRPLGRGLWELIGTCADGSVIVWRVEG